MRAREHDRGAGFGDCRVPSGSLAISVPHPLLGDNQLARLTTAGLEHGQAAPRPNPQLAPATIRLTLGTNFRPPSKIADASEAADPPKRPETEPPTPAVPASSISAGRIPCVK